MAVPRRFDRKLVTGLGTCCVASILCFAVGLAALGRYALWYMTRGDDPVYKIHLHEQQFQALVKRAKEHPNDARAHLDLAERLHAAKWNEVTMQGEAEYRLALRLDPKCIPAKEGLASLYLEFKKYKPAIVEFTDLARVKPDPAVYLDLALCYRGLGDYEKAIKAADKAETLDRGSPEYTVWIADDYHQMHRDDLATRLWTKSLGMSGSNADWWWHKDAKEGLAALGDKGLMKSLDEAIRNGQR